MRNAQGYITISTPEKTLESDTFTCGHCNSIVVVPHRCDPAELGGLCKQCFKLVCPTCNAKGICTPWEKQMEKIEARHRFLRSAGL